MQNISTRLNIPTGENVLIGGFIITGEDSKRVIVRAIGPALGKVGLAAHWKIRFWNCMKPTAPLDPVLELHDADGDLLASNDNWKDTQETEIEATGLAPTIDAESALLQTLPSGAYTAILRGAGDTTGGGVGRSS